MNKILNQTVIACFISFTIMSCVSDSKPDTYAATYFEGASNAGKTGDKPYLTAGDKCYIVGTQDGLFPDLGEHVKDEMGGIWSHPIKLADGYWLKVDDIADNSEQWLMKADNFITYPYGSKFIYNPILNGIEISRLQYAPDGLHGVIVEYTIKNNSAKERNLKLDFVLKTDLRPVWSSEKIDVFDYPDELSWDTQNNTFVAKDSVNQWFAVWGTSSKVSCYSTDKIEPVQTAGKGKSGLITSALTLHPQQQITVTYALAGSTVGRSEALATYKRLITEKDDLLLCKKQSFTKILQRSRITIPDKQLETTYNWVKINTHWLEMDLDGTGRFLGAGAIEYPWLFGCDNEFAQQGVVASGDFDLAQSTLTILKNVSEKTNGNGQIIHEMSTNGFVYNKGNTQETAQYVVAAWRTFEWTGDIHFLKSIYPYIKKGINWLTVDMDQNKDLFPEGYGIMEVQGLNAELIDVAVYTQQALELASQMASILGEDSIAKDYLAKSKTLKQKINDDFWDEEAGSYCDFYGTRETALTMATRAITDTQISYPGDEGKKMALAYQAYFDKVSKFPHGIERGWFPSNQFWIINTPFETGIAPKDRAIRSMDDLRANYCGEYGPHLSGVEKKRMMTIGTGVMAMSEAQYGRTDQCLWYMKGIAATLGRTFPGSINEMTPDYGCPTQAWTIYGIATPLITYIFGVQPNAYLKQVTFAPHLPTGWNAMSLENQRVGNNVYSIQIMRSKESVKYTITSHEKDWKNTLYLQGLSGKEYEINGKKMTASSDEIVLKGITNSIEVSM